MKACALYPNMEVVMRSYHILGKYNTQINFGNTYESNTMEVSYTNIVTNNQAVFANDSKIYKTLVRKEHC